MGLYRDSDIKAYTILAILANISVAVSFVMIAVYHFYEPQLVYRDLGFVALLISFACRVQISIQKVEILEKRTAGLMRVELPGGKLAASSANLGMIFYLTVVWISFILVLMAHLPANWRFSSLVH